MSEHFLNRAQIGTSLEEVRGEGVTEQVGVDARRVEARLLGDAPQDQERACASERPAARVQEHLGAVAGVEVGPAAREVAAERLGGGPPDRHDAFLVSLADDSHGTVLEVDAAADEADRLGHAQPGAVEELDERLVAERARRRAGGRVDQAFGLAGREGLREGLRPPRQRHARRRVVGADAEELQVAEEATGGGVAPGDRRGRKPVRAQLRGVALEVLDARRRHRPAEERGERAEVARVGVDGARRAARREQGEKAVELGVPIHGSGFAAVGASSWRARGGAAGCGAPSSSSGWRRSSSGPSP